MTTQRSLLTSYLSFILFIVLFISSCKNEPKTIIPAWQSFDESAVIESVKDHEIPRMRYQLIQSKVQDKNLIWDAIRDDIAEFGQDDYEKLMEYIYEKDIPSIQSAVTEGKLSYEQLVKWYLYRIVKFENDSTTTLNTIVALNPDAVEEARKIDRAIKEGHHPIYGMPILLKDNINTAGMNTTAGAIALKDNQVEDAFIVKQLKSHGAIILGKVNLSEWAYFFCGGCPVGYSAIGGQTLNPYGRGKFETGGSSAGSGTGTAANYAVAAVGTETSGSILSPSSKNSLVGLKPTVGVLSRSGIVPISSTLDTPGPMTKSVRDNAILLSAMSGEDLEDPVTLGKDRTNDYLQIYQYASLAGKRLGYEKRFLEDSLFNLTISYLKSMGVELVGYDRPEVDFDGFGTLLSADMKRDLPRYLSKYAGSLVDIKSVQDVIDFNLLDSLVRAPYGQVRLEGSAMDTTSDEELALLSARLDAAGKQYFDMAIDEYQLDAVLSINNYSAGFAAAAKYPCLTIPMGYTNAGEPYNITFITKSQREAKLLQLGYAFEQATQMRVPPVAYD